MSAWQTSPHGRRAHVHAYTRPPCPAGCTLSTQMPPYPLLKIHSQRALACSSGQHACAQLHARHATCILMLANLTRPPFPPPPACWPERQPWWEGRWRVPDGRAPPRSFACTHSGDIDGWMDGCMHHSPASAASLIPPRCCRDRVCAGCVRCLQGRKQTCHATPGGAAAAAAAAAVSTQE